jgi:hypothetical protein
VLTSRDLIGYFCGHPHRDVAGVLQLWLISQVRAGVAETGSKRGPAAWETVDVLGVKALAFIVADVDRIIQFLNVTGLQPETIREAAQSSLFLLGVLDYVSKDDELLRAIHQELNIAPAAILTALGHQTPASETKRLDRKNEAAPSLPRRNLFK